MRSLFSVGIAAAWAAYVLSTPLMAQTPAPPSTGQDCREYTDQIMLAGQPHTVHGHVCLQPDGTWRVMQDAKILPTPQGACHEHYEDCDRSCDVDGILGARHVHADCSVTCDMICGRREGYAPWRKTEEPPH